MKGRLILAHDLGTTGDKATLFDENGTLLASTLSGYRTLYPHVGWAEQDPRQWWKACCHSTGTLLAKAGVSGEDIRGVCFSGQMMGCVPVDGSGQPLRNAIIWADQRAQEQAERIRSQVGSEHVYRVSGHPVSSSYSLAKILWVRDNQPELFCQVRCCLHAKDYVVHRLTGQLVTDYSDASGMNLFDLRRKTWDETILEAAELDAAVLPGLHPSTDVVGEVTREAAEATGLSPGTAVVIGGGDGPCATLGAGVIGPGITYAYVGSSAWVGAASSDPLYDAEERVGTFHHVVPDTYMPAGSMQAAGASYEWLQECVCVAETMQAGHLGVSPYELMNVEADRAPAGSGNLVFLPYLMGERSPYWNPAARGAFVGLTRRHRRGDLVRAVIEGVVFNLHCIHEIMQQQLEPAREFRVIGGAARSRVFRQIMADILGRPVLRPAMMEAATSLGAAMIGAVGTGVVDGFEAACRMVSVSEATEPQKHVAGRYQELFSVFQDAYHALVPVYDRLARLEEEE